MKKFKKYLLENYPLVFETRFFEFVAMGIALWIFAFISGYALWNLDLANDLHFTRFYENNGIYTFHLFFAILIVALWSIRFYKLGAIRNYYPITKGYFTKMLFLLLLPFFILVSAYIPFTAGAKIKNKTIITEQFHHDYIKVLEAQPFLVSEINNHLLDPSLVSPHHNVLFWNPNSLKIKNKNLLERRMELDKGALDPELLYQNTHTFTDGVYSFLYYKSKLEYLDLDSCRNKTIFDAFFSPENKEKIHFTSIYNFVNRPNYLSRFQRLTYNERNNSEDKELYNSILKESKSKIENIIAQKDYKKLQEIIEGFVGVLDKYQINYDISVKEIIKYHKTYQFKNYPIALISSDSYFNANDEDLYNTVSTECHYLYDSNPNAYYTPEKRYYEERNWDNLTGNYRHQKIIKLESIMGLLLLSLLLSVFFMIFKWTEILNFLISIPVAGALMILFGILNVFIDIPHKFQSLALLFYVLLIIMISLYIIQKEQISRKLKSISINILLPAMVMILPILYFAISENWTYEKISPCSYTPQEIKYLPRGIEIYSIFLGCFIGILVFQSFIKKWKASKY
ncbi:MAG: hypothetical protein N4A45_13455 [Flavobacteriales bacterium]|jgi:hypothetical protein|nr:hypothetical protein [Flavobacteriales bacterium]